MSERIPQSPPVIHPLSNTIVRPLMSVMIPTFNCITYLKETLESVIVQDLGVDKMQIEVVDDCSTDGDVEALVNQIGRGRIKFFRQEVNKGSLRNFETCINRAQGHLVHILHGDDRVKPGFYVEIANLFNTFPVIGAALTRHSVINENSRELFESINIQEEAGIIEDWLLKIAQKQLTNPPAIVVRRGVYEKLGGFYAVQYGEDWEMWARIGTQFKVAYSPNSLASYRFHNNNVTSNAFASGQNIKDIKKVIGIIQNYLPPDKKEKIKYQAKRYFSVYFTKMAYKIVERQKDPTSALKQIRGALDLQINTTTVAGFLRIYLRTFMKFK